MEYKLKCTLAKFKSMYIASEQNLKEYDYERYKTPVGKFIFHSIVGAGMIFAGSWIFYRFLPISLALSTLGILLPIIRGKEETIKVRNNLRTDFGELLSSLADSLKTGMSFERALVIAQGELFKTEEGRNKKIKKELDLIISSSKANIPVSLGFENLAKRSQVDEIETFSTVLPITLRKGGDIVGLMKKTADMIKERSRINGEIEVILAEKKMEKRIVDMAPFFMMYMLSTTSPDFMAPVFNTLVGRLAITFALLLFIMAWYLSGKIMRIEV